MITLYCSTCHAELEELKTSNDLHTFNNKINEYLMLECPNVHIFIQTENNVIVDYTMFYDDPNDISVRYHLTANMKHMWTQIRKGDLLSNSRYGNWKEILSLSNFIPPVIKDNIVQPIIPRLLQLSSFT